MNTKLYLGYGMNTNLHEMAYRCPRARSLGHARLLNSAFRFATHADVVVVPDCYVDGVLWSITDECLKKLDALEGFPHYYNRMEMAVEHDGEIKDAIVYFMNPGQPDGLPSQGYFDLLIEGYTQHNVPTDQLHNALELWV
jgi:gamma-glutamylcyclotransferase (GGCT)/AIG2-like uncharacterized protein YtfP